MARLMAHAARRMSRHTGWPRVTGGRGPQRGCWGPGVRGQEQNWVNGTIRQYFRPPEGTTRLPAPAPPLQAGPAQGGVGSGCV